MEEEIIYHEGKLKTQIDNNTITNYKCAIISIRNKIINSTTARNKYTIKELLNNNFKIKQRSDEYYEKQRKRVHEETIV